MEGVASKRNGFLGKNFVYPTIKEFQNFFPNLKYQLKNKYPPLAKNFTKGYRSVVTLMPFTTSVTRHMSLITAC
jgi:hypothetical protein